ncbi:MAG TPA: hypothetical protein VJP39_04215 [Gaiellaceae bacterium]|nr:hypothetical protein [Gaiellaceae bacterium]
MSRPGVAATCAVALLAGFITGRVTGSGSSETTTVTDTVDHVVAVTGHNLGAATDPRDSGLLDLRRVSSVRSGDMLKTTIVAGRAWHDSLLRRGRVRLSILYDSNDDGRTDRRDVVFLFRGRIASWISSFGQGVQAATVTRRSPTTLMVARGASVFYDASGEAGRLKTSPIGVAVLARWKGGADRVPNRGWITVLPPGATTASP